MSRKSVAGTPADPTLQFVRLELGDTTYRLAFDFNAIATAEAETGLNLLTTFSTGGLSAAQLRAVFWACLLKAHPEMTIDQAGALITPRTLSLIADRTVQAWTGSMPEVTEKNEEAPEPES